MVIKAHGLDEATKLRRFDTKDLARRLGAISPDRIFINGFPARSPAAAFNPGLGLDGDYLVLYPRIVVGYYKYVSAIVEVRIPLSDVVSGTASANVYASNLAVLPSTEYDFWGAEDPRVYRINDLEVMTYTGRTSRYFSSEIERTLPITAVRIDGVWRRVIVHKPPPGLGSVKTDKNAFLVETGGSLFLFHRPETGKRYQMLASKLPYKVLSLLELPPSEPDSAVPLTSWEVIQRAAFEEKIGWATPPIPMRDGLLVFLHGVDNRINAYRVFATLIEAGKDGIVLKAVTPRYIMAPRENYEVYGDRPLTIFPCGAVEIDEGILVSYGAADYMIGLALIDVDDLLSELDLGRIY